MTTKPGDIAAAFPAFLERKLIECEAAAALGDTEAAAKVESLRRLLGPARAAAAEAPPKPPDPGLFTQSPAGTRRITPGGIGGTQMDAGMNKIIEAQDILAAARNCVECIFMASADLSREEADPIQVVADIASGKINEAIAILKEYRGGPNASPVPDAPSVKPVSRAARTKRKGK